MIPGVPPANPHYPNRRQQQQHEYQYAYPPHGSNPYYAHVPQHYHPQLHAPQYAQQWYSQYPQQYQQPPRQFHPPPSLPPPPLSQQQHAPLIVSSHPGQQFYPTPMTRPNIPTAPAQAQVQTPTPPQAMPFTPTAVSHMQQSPAPSTESVAASTPPPSSTSGPSTTADSFGSQLPSPDLIRTSFRPPLPWLSVPEEEFPPRAARKCKPRRKIQPQDSEVLELPARPRDETVAETEEPLEAGETTEEQSESQASTMAARSENQTPATSQAPSEIDSEQPPTPISSTRPGSLPADNRSVTRPVVPIIPVLPKKASPAASSPESVDTETKETSVVSSAPSDTPSSDTLQPSSPVASLPELEKPIAPAVRAAPKSWADLVRTKAAKPAAPSATTNGGSKSDEMNGSKAGSLADAIRSFSVDSDSKVAFLKPRGLVNSGNLCYMNSVLQILAFCTPFYDFLDTVGKRAVHNFQSVTPLLDAMILFLQEFPVIDSATSVEQLKLRLKKEELDQFGEPFKPENVYSATRANSKFAKMTHGHQQDAEEYMNKLLEVLHDECMLILGTNSTTTTGGVQSQTSTRSVSDDAGWEEVGPKKRSTVINSSGTSSLESPITKIFGGVIRSELRAPGQQDRTKRESFQHLPLDINVPEVHNILDALKGLTRSEAVHGYKSERGDNVTGRKRFLFESLPPVLILSLKRFSWSDEGGAKIWKKVGYPLELTMPKEVFTAQQRNAMGISGYPKYQLDGVIYHHGKNITSGHYTVDVRRQEGQEWIRIDDTVIRRVRREDVATAGAEEDPKVLAKALEQHQRAISGKTNIFDQFGELDDETSSENGGAWNQAGAKEGANGASPGAAGKKWSTIANGTATPKNGGDRVKADASGTPRDDGKAAESKQAYILFYRKIS